MGNGSPSNYFTQNPVIDTAYPLFGTEKVYFYLHGFQQLGLLWVIVVPATQADDITLVREVKSGKHSVGGLECKLNRQKLDAYNLKTNSQRYFVHLLRQCDLVMGRSYTLVAYVEDFLTENNDGTIAKTTFAVPLVEAAFQPDSRVLKYSDTSVAALTEARAHVYHVRGVNSAGMGVSSGKSDVVYNAAVPSTPLPPQPLYKARTSVNLRWEPPFNGGLPVASYTLYIGQIERMTKDLPTEYWFENRYVPTQYVSTDGAPNEGTWSRHLLGTEDYFDHQEGCSYKEIYSGKDPEFTVTKLIPRRKYKFRVRANNAIGPSNISDPVNVTTCAPPSIPANVSIHSRSFTEIQIWFKPPVEVDGCPVLGYRPRVDGILYDEQMVRRWLITTTKNQNHTFEVQARTDGGQSAFTELVRVFAGTGMPPMVTAPTILAASQDYVSLSWDTMNADVIKINGFDILFFRVFIRDNETNTMKYNDTEEGSGVTSIALFANYSLGVSGGWNGTDIPGTLEKGRYYCFSVAAVNEISASNALNDQHPLPSPENCGWTAEVPLPPTTLYLDRSVKERVTVSWPLPPEVDMRGAEIDYYEVMQATISADGLTTTPFTIVSVISANDRFYKAQSCVTASTLSFKVRAHNKVGWGEQTSVYTTTCATYPDKPNPPTRVASSPASITLAWTAPETNGVAISSYEIFPCLRHLICVVILITHGSSLAHGGGAHHLSLQMIHVSPCLL